MRNGCFCDLNDKGVVLQVLLIMGHGLRENSHSDYRFRFGTSTYDLVFVFLRSAYFSMHFPSRFVVLH